MQEWLQKSISTFRFADSATPYVAIRELIERIGLDWEEQRAIFREEDHWGYREELQMSSLHAGLPAAKVFIWLKTVDVTKVLPELQRPLFDYQEQSRHMTQNAFLNSDLLAFARAKDPAERSPLEQKLVEAGDLLARQKESP